MQTMCYAKHLAFINLLLMSCMTYLHLYVFVSVMLSVRTCLYIHADVSIICTDATLNCKVRAAPSLAIVIPVQVKEWRAKAACK
jgi:hypothetical protein